MRTIFSIRLLLTLLLPLLLAACQSLPSLSWQQTDIPGDLPPHAASMDADSQYREGIRLTSGEEAQQDYRQGVAWFRLAAGQGHAGAAYMVGIAYAVGRGVERDQRHAVGWFEQAAAAGHVRALYQLGDAYLNGRGVAKEPAWGMRWMGKAAMAGHREAQLAQGVGFASGLGLPKQPSGGLAWIILAEKAGEPTAAKLRRRLEKRLSAVQLERARRIADAWRPAKADPGFFDGATVRYVQFMLQQKGIDAGGVDGVYGPRTEAAIKTYLGGDNGPPASLLERAALRLHAEASS